MIKEFCEKNRKALFIGLIAVIVIALIGVCIAFALKPNDEPLDVVNTTSAISSEVSSVEVSSIPVVVVPEIEKPVISSVPVSSQEQVGSAPISSSAPVINVVENVTDKKETPVEKPVSKPVEPPKPVELTMPQPTPELAKPANRNMPSFTIDTSVIGSSGIAHGTKDGSEYYHAGLNVYLDEEYFFVYRYGEHPEATTQLMYAPQVSPYQQDGDFNPFRHRGDYHCKACNGWVGADGWENGKHFDGNPKHQ